MDWATYFYGVLTQITNLFAQLAMLVLVWFREFNPEEWATWIHLLYATLGILWLGYQFNRLRGRGDKDFDEWIESQLEKMRRNLGRERKSYLEQLNYYAKLPMWRRSIIAF